LATALLHLFVNNSHVQKAFSDYGQSCEGRPLSQSNIVRRHLHEALERLGYVNPFTGTHKAGNHAFRRFRNTYLRNHTACPDGLIKFWLGHADKDMTDRYDRIREDATFRRDVAERCGFGFKLPGIVPNVSNCAEEPEVENAVQVV
jgi:integrase